MEQSTLRQLRGAVELAADTVEATTNAASTTHRTIMAGTYDILALVPPLARPVRLLERIQWTITAGVYESVLVINRAVRVVSARKFDHLERDRVS